MLTPCVRMRVCTFVCIPACVCTRHVCTRVLGVGSVIRTAAPRSSGGTRAGEGGGGTAQCCGRKCVLSPPETKLFFVVFYDF